MSLFSRQTLIVAFLTLHVLALAQTPVTPRSVLANPWATAAQPAVPSDPLEIAANAEPVQDIAQRATAINLLNQAQFLSNLRRVSYDVKTQFTSSEGSWQLEDTSPERNIYRWTVQGPSYSAVNLFLNRVIYSNQPASAIPLRVAQVHSAIFGHYPMYGPRATLRLASGNLNGTQVTCVLVSHVFNVKPASGPRRWEEYESCIDPKSGLLISYSPVPGLYILYDYSNAQRLADVIFPGKFTITQAGQTVAEVQVESLTAGLGAEASIFNPAGLNALGVGFPLNPLSNILGTSFVGQPHSASSMLNAQVVVVHGMLSSDGHLTDPEVLASSNPSLNQQALERAATMQSRRPSEEGQNGATPESQEVFFTTLFLN